MRSSLSSDSRSPERVISVSVPRWDGLWQPAGNSHMGIFVDGPGFTGKVRDGVLTAAYEQAYKERWRQQQEPESSGDEERHQAGQ